MSSQLYLIIFILLDQPEVQSKIIVHRNSGRRKFTDILQDVGRQKIIRRYETAGKFHI